MIETAASQSRSSWVVAGIGVVALLIAATVLAGAAAPPETEPNDSPPNATEIETGVSVTGETTSGTNPDYFAFTAEAGDVITVSASSTGEGSNTEFDVVDKNGDSLASTPDLATGQSGKAGTTASYSGTYYVRVRPYFGATGASYDFEVSTVGSDDFEPNENRGKATAIVDEQAVSGSLTRTDADWFAFEANRGEAINVSIRASAGGATNVYLRNRTGGLLNDTQNVRGSTSYVTATANYSGQYYVEVVPRFEQNYGAEYDLAVDLPGDPSTGPSTNGASGGSQSSGGFPLLMVVPVVLVVPLVVLIFLQFRDDGEEEGS